MLQRMVRLSLAVVAASFILVSVSARPAYAAATHTWTGLGATNEWSDAANWDLGVPTAGDTLVFPATAQRKANDNTLPPNTSFLDIQITGSGYDIDGSAVEVTGELVSQAPGGTNTVRLNVNGSGEVRVASGKLALSGNNSFDGNALVQAGVLLAQSDMALGGEPGITIVSTGATLQLSGGIDPGTEGISLSGNGFDGLGALQSLSGTNQAPDVAINGPVTVGVGNSVLIMDSLTGGGGAALTLVGGGKLQVDSTPFGGFAGLVTVAEGNLTWNAGEPPSPAVNVQRDAWLRGTGTVASINVTAGRVWPGSGNAPGRLSSVGATTFNSGYFKVDLDGPTAGSEYGQLATGGLSLNPLATLLELELTFVPNIGQVFRIIDNNSGGPVAGTFLDLPEGAIFAGGGQAFQISYKGGDGNDVTITVLRQLSADLKLTAEAAPSPVAPGGTLAYSVTLTNQGPDRASSPTVTMGTPVGTTFDSATAPTGWTCSKPSNSPNVQCTRGAFDSGASATFVFRFEVNSGVTGSITGSVSASSQTNDPASANNSVTLVTPTGQGGTPALPFRRYLVLIAADK